MAIKYVTKGSCYRVSNQFQKRQVKVLCWLSAKRFSDFCRMSACAEFFIVDVFPVEYSKFLSLETSSSLARFLDGQ